MLHDGQFGDRTKGFRNQFPPPNWSRLDRNLGLTRGDSECPSQACESVRAKLDSGTPCLVVVNSGFLCAIDLKVQKKVLPSEGFDKPWRSAEK